MGDFVRRNRPDISKTTRVKLNKVLRGELDPSEISKNIRLEHADFFEEVAKHLDDPIDTQFNIQRANYLRNPNKFEPPGKLGPYQDNFPDVPGLR